MKPVSPAYANYNDHSWNCGARGRRESSHFLPAFDDRFGITYLRWGCVRCRGHLLSRRSSQTLSRPLVVYHWHCADRGWISRTWGRDRRCPDTTIRGYMVQSWIDLVPFGFRGAFVVVRTQAASLPPRTRKSQECPRRACSGYELTFRSKLFAFFAIFAFVVVNLPRMK